jgi:hypothetical protein
VISRSTAIRRLQRLLHQRVGQLEEHTRGHSLRAREPRHVCPSVAGRRGTGQRQLGLEHQSLGVTASV